jgi:hypothetical protein
MIVEFRPALSKHRDIPAAALAPCPFCKDEAEVVESCAAKVVDGQFYPAVFVAQCSECLCQGPGGVTILEATNQWNNRPAAM